MHSAFFAVAMRRAKLETYIVYLDVSRCRDYCSNRFPFHLLRDGAF
jgi:hypothetical protein